MADIYLDGEKVATIDLNSSVADLERGWCMAGFLDGRQHRQLAAGHLELLEFVFPASMTLRVSTSVVRCSRSTSALRFTS